MLLGRFSHFAMGGEGRIEPTQALNMGKGGTGVLFVTVIKYNFHFH